MKMVARRPASGLRAHGQTESGPGDEVGAVAARTHSAGGGRCRAPVDEGATPVVGAAQPPDIGAIRECRRHTGLSAQRVTILATTADNAGATGQPRRSISEDTDV